MPDEPDLAAEMDAAEDIVMGRAETVVTEWGVRDSDDRVWSHGTNEQDARKVQPLVYGGGVLVRRTVTYGPWEEAPGEQRAETGDPGSAGEAQPG